MSREIGVNGQTDETSRKHNCRRQLLLTRA